MAIMRTTSNVVLPVDVSREVWQEAQAQSAFMQLAQRSVIPGTGKSFQTITGDPTAEWVAEGAAKPVGTFTFGKKTVTPYKAAIIVPFSNEFRRDAKALYEACVGRLPGALAKLFDTTIMGTTAPGTGFDVLGGCSATTLAATGAYPTLVTVASTIATAGGIMNGIAVAPQGNAVLLSAVDGDGHPLFTPGVGSATVGNILGSKVVVNKNVYKAAVDASQGTSAVAATYGIAGDWTTAYYGIVEDISIAVSDQATLTVGSGDDEESINLFQQNMFAVRVEFETAFYVKDASNFMLLRAAS